MKRILLILIILFLTACGSNDTTEDPSVNENDNDEIQEDEIETLFEKEINITISDNDDLRVDLLHVAHGRSQSTDNVSLQIEVENKQNKTFKFYIDSLKIDGREIDSLHAWISDGEIDPEEIKTTYINGYEYEELTFKEHISGTIIYNDYEGNRNKLQFSEYINE